MILLELYTESGAVYTANVIHQRIRRTGPDGEVGEWMDYVRLCGGEVGTPLEIYLADGITEPLITTPIVKLNHPVVE
jgi:hypothetical protein